MIKTTRTRKIASYLAYFICALFVVLMLFIWTQLRIYVDRENVNSYSLRINELNTQALSKLDTLFSLFESQQLLMERNVNMTQVHWENFFEAYLASNPHPEVTSIEYVRFLKTSLPVSYVYSTKTAEHAVGYDYESVSYLAEKLRASVEKEDISVVRRSSINSGGTADILLVKPHLSTTGNVAGIFVVHVSSKELYSSMFSSELPNQYSTIEVLVRNSQGLYKKIYEHMPSSVTSADANLSEGNVISEFDVKFADEDLQFRYFYNPTFASSTTSRLMPNIILLFGLILVFLMYSVYKTFETARAKALDSVHHATSELRKYKLALDSVSDHVVITDPDGIILYANPTVERITGFSHQAIVGKKAGDATLWGGLMPKEFYKQLWDTIKIEKKTFAGGVKNKRKNGEIYHAQVKISPILNKHQELVYFVGIERDITEEKMQDLIKEQLDTFFGISQELLCIATTQGYFVKLSNSFQKTLGWALEELLDKPYLSLVHAGDLFYVKESLQKLNSGEAATNFKCRIMCKDGSYKEFHWHLVTDFNGYLYCIAHEIA